MTVVFAAHADRADVAAALEGPMRAIETYRAEADDPWGPRWAGAWADARALLAELDRIDAVLAAHRRDRVRVGELHERVHAEVEGLVEILPRREDGPRCGARYGRCHRPSTRRLLGRPLCTQHATIEVRDEARRRADAAERERQQRGEETPDEQAIAADRDLRRAREAARPPGMGYRPVLVGEDLPG